MEKIINQNGKAVLTAFHDIHPYSHRANIFGDGIACIDGWDFSKANLNEENRIRAITQVASICYQSPKALGSDSLYRRLAAESIGLPSSSFEFVPVLLDPWKLESKKLIGGDRTNARKFGEWINAISPTSGLEQEYLLTNYRALYYDYEKACKEASVIYANRPDVLKSALSILEDDYLKFFNTEKECEIIKDHFKVFLFNVDFPTRSQMVRHRVNWQELSRRYVSGKRIPFNFYVSEGMKKVKSIRKIDGVIESDDGVEVTRSSHIENTTVSLINQCVEHYYAALEQGIKPQEARRIIPQAAYTQIWGAFQPAQLQNFFDLRMDEHAQFEIRKCAEAMYNIIESYKNFPKMTPEQEEACRRLQEIADGKAEFITKEEINNLLDAAEMVDENGYINEATLEDALDLLKG